MLRMKRPGHSLTLKTLLMKRTLVELPPSSKSKSLLFAALDMTDGEDSGVAGGLTKEINQLKHVQPSPGDPLSPPRHISVMLVIFYSYLSLSNPSPEDVPVRQLLSRIMYFLR